MTEEMKEIRTLFYLIKNYFKTFFKCHNDFADFQKQKPSSIRDIEKRNKEVK